MKILMLQEGNLEYWEEKGLDVGQILRAYWVDCGPHQIFSGFSADVCNSFMINELSLLFLFRQTTATTMRTFFNFESNNSIFSKNEN